MVTMTIFHKMAKVRFSDSDAPDAGGPTGPLNTPGRRVKRVDVAHRN